MITAGRPRSSNHVAVGGGDMAKRRPKLPLASAGRGPQVELAQGDWARLERAYGYPLPDPLRASILEATEKFLMHAEFEQTAPDIAEADKYISAVKKAAGELRKAILGRPGLAIFKARQLLRELADLPADDDRDGVTYLAWCTLPDLARACDAATAELSELGVGNFRDGAAWDRWVRELTALLHSRRLPTGARKDSDKNAGDPSPFVALVWEMQERIPPRFRRSDQSLHALTAMVTRARTPRGEKIAPIENDDAE